jgi:hypothetical protein
MINGKDIVILDSTGSAVIAAAKSCELNINADTLEVASPTSGTFKSHIPGRKGWTVNINHLLMSIARFAPMVGTSLTIKLSINGSNGLPFDGFISNPGVEQVGLSGKPDKIYWDTNRNQFIGLKLAPMHVNDKYYLTWSQDDGYLTPIALAAFNYNGQTYTWLSNTLVKERLSGNVIVTNWRAVGTVGNLANGTFTFLGNGPLESELLT